MYNIGFLLSFVAPVQLLFPLLNSNLVLTGVISVTGSTDLYAAILNLHTNILQQYQSVHAELRYGANGAVIIGMKIADNRGRYLAMIRTNNRIISVRVVDTEHIAYSIINGSETTYPSE